MTGIGDESSQPIAQETKIAMAPPAGQLATLPALPGGCKDPPGFPAAEGSAHLEDHGTLVSRVISTFIKVISRYSYSYPTYNPTY